MNRIFRMMQRKKKKDEKFFRKPGDSARKKRIDRHTKESALAFFLEHGYTKRRYSSLVKDNIRRHENRRSRNIYPSYRILKEAKADCLPLAIQNNESQVRTPLQQLANKTGERLCESVATQWSHTALKLLKLIFCGGFDSSSGHTNSQQKCQDPANECNDAHQTLFVTSITPLQLISESAVACDEYKWTNPTPASYRYCRPLRIAFEKETAETIAQEYERLKSEIKRLKSHEFRMKNGKTISLNWTKPE
ncbi:hypothetical protein QAD02_007170 [Eretmocerus hayati]|uniref:Uncharacterized protein n=1 Tax=Eretmocerus hayati TaxID=131215 RepID=A0ACC2N459_9HYME|nr:hypothetical protein QAD02_007170 [Eretmocerus hayati]